MSQLGEWSTTWRSHNYLFVRMTSCPTNEIWGHKSIILTANGLIAPAPVYSTRTVGIRQRDEGASILLFEGAYLGEGWGFGLDVTGMEE